MKLSIIMTALALACAARGQDSVGASFDELTRAGFKQVSAQVVRYAPEPPAQEPADSRGVFLFAGNPGSIYFCSAGGCRRLLAGRAASAVASADGLYFTGPDGAGYCAPSGCRTLLAGHFLVFPLKAGPDGDIYGVDSTGLWHCQAWGCARSYSGKIADGANYLDGEWKDDGDFVASPRGGTFWCSKGDCRKIADHEMIAIDGNCRNAAPEDSAFGFWALSLYRCAPQGCRTVLDNDANVQTYTDCAFDAQGRILLNSKIEPSLVCGDSCRASSQSLDSIAAAKPEKPWSSEQGPVRGSDGADYRLADRSRESEPAAGGRQSLGAIVTRDGRALAFDAPAACWQWFVDDDDDSAGWSEDCSLMP